MAPNAPLVISEPTLKRAVTFIDGQNLYHQAREAFNCSHPNYDVLKLSQEVCKVKGWQLCEARFYTGIPDAADDSQWNSFWVRKLAAMGRQGVRLFSRHLRYRDKTVKLDGGVTLTFRDGEEKGIDVRIALDVIRLAIANAYDVAVIFSQDQDLSEVATEIRAIAQKQKRWIKAASAFPVSSKTSNRRGINGTDWIELDQALYEACIDPRDYRAAPPAASAAAGVVK